MLSNTAFDCQLFILRGLITPEKSEQSFTSYRKNETSSLLSTSHIFQPLPVLPVGAVATL